MKNDTKVTLPLMACAFTFQLSSSLANLTNEAMMSSCGVLITAAAFHKGKYERINDLSRDVTGEKRSVNLFYTFHSFIYEVQ